MGFNASREHHPLFVSSSKLSGELSCWRRRRSKIGTEGLLSSIVQVVAVVELAESKGLFSLTGQPHPNRVGVVDLAEPVP